MEDMEKKDLSLIDRVNQDLSHIMNENTLVTFTDTSDREKLPITIKAIVNKKTLNYTPLENVLIAAPEHRVTVRKDDFTLNPKDFDKVEVSWINASGKEMKGFISENYPSDTMSTIVFIIKIGIEKRI